MQSQVNTTQIITLELTEEEARYLKALVQNYLGGDPAAESTENRQMREMFWNSLAAVHI